MEPSTLASGTLQFPVADDAERLSRRTSRTSLPKVWIGYALAALCFAAFVGGVVSSDKAALGIANVASLAGSVYWLYCIYRIHKVLAEATLGHYPISARRAVGFQLIPIYSLIWSFKWPKGISRFLKQAANPQLRHHLVGICLVAAVLLGVLPTGLNLALLFTVGAYLTRAIGKVLPWAAPVTRREQVALPLSARLAAAWDKRKFNLAVSAALGAGCGLVLGKALEDMIERRIPWTWAGLVAAAVAIVCASLAAVIFVEPLAERCRVRLGVHPAHLAAEPRSPMGTRVILFVLLATTSTTHAFLEGHIEGLLDSLRNVEALLAEPGIPNLLTVLLFVFFITYSWMLASRRSASGAVQLGAATGAAIALLVAYFVWGLAVAVRLFTKQIVHLRYWKQLLRGAQSDGIQLLRYAANHLLVLAAAGAVFGLVGLAVRHQSKRGLLGMYAALTTSALLFGIARHRAIGLGLLVNLLIAVGWCLGLLVEPHAEAILTGTPPAPDEVPKAAGAAA